MSEKLTPGEVVYLKDYTAPKMFRNISFECLLSDQAIPMSANIKVVKKCGHIKKWPSEIWNKERFAEYLK